MITGRFCPDSPEEGYEKQQIIGLCPEEHILISDFEKQKKEKAKRQIN